MRTLISLIAKAFVASTLTISTAHAGVTDPLLNPLCPSIDTKVPAPQRKAGFVKIAPGRELYTDYVKPAAGKPTIVLVNGLTYRTGCWDAFVRELHDDGYGILRYDPIGQGKTLLKYAAKLGEISYEDQVGDLGKLLDAMNLRSVHLVGLSYGGGIGFAFLAKYPSRVETFTALAPFVAPIDWQDNYLRLQVKQARILYPYWNASDDEIYDTYLRNFVYASYPSFEPIVLENPYKLEATFRLVQGIRKLVVLDLAPKLAKNKLHLVVAGQDTYVPHPMHENFWNALPKGIGATRLIIEGAGHKIPELEPRFAARWVKEVVRGNPDLAKGRTFLGRPWSGNASSGSIVIDGLGER